MTTPIRIILFAFLLALGDSATAQGMFGFMGGAGYAHGRDGYKGHVTPTFEGYYLGKLSRHFYAGGSISFQRYYLVKDMGVNVVTAGFGQPISIRQESNYLYLCAKADIGIGYRNLFHVLLAVGPGLNTGGQQFTTQKMPLSHWGGYLLYDFETSYNITNVVARATMGISERIPTHRYWNIMLSQEFTWTPTSLTKQGENSNTNYFACTVGIMHKYPHVRVQNQEEK